MFVEKNDQVAELSAAHGALRSEHEHMVGLCLNADAARLHSLVKVVEARKAAAVSALTSAGAGSTSIKAPVKALAKSGGGKAVGKAKASAGRGPNRRLKSPY